MQQALEALDSDSPDIQLRAAIAIRKALERKCTETHGKCTSVQLTKVWTQAHWTAYEHSIVAAEREKVVDALRCIEALEAEILRLRGWDSPSDAELAVWNLEHEHLFSDDDDVWAYERAFERWLFKRNA